MMSTIKTFMQGDHDRLDGRFQNVQTLIGEDADSVARRFAEFRQGLQRHIVWEEEILFPIFDERSGMEGQGPTAVMRREHRAIKDHLERIHDRLAHGQPIDDVAKELVEALLVHNKKEEHVLYPWLDRMVGEGEAEQLIARMEAMPEEQFHQCCGSMGHEKIGGG